ncbi:putative pyrimidine reductase [Microbacterium sp. C448]|uniref:dihydrofolate reductase family protein n=1 Tax=Microbacterium sp. C448 TaxID=1177594 RepID=UPI0003DE22A1|nr:dihydrofolate reductase family protein [Microbacterium sp. C448]CDK00723.1 putative pyrimidine reductase [Microbacterium sp. C448]
MSTPVLVTELLPRTLAEADVSTPAGRAWLETVYAPAAGNRVRLNMITSLTGSAVGSDGTSETLTSQVDRAILGIIRAAADVVVVGASTVRAEGYLAPRSAALAIVTATGRLDGHRLDAEDGRTGRILLVCPAARASAVASERDAQGIDAEIVAVPGGDDLDPRAILDALRDHGLDRAVCEGGPTLASRFVEAGMIDELCVTVTPVVGPAPSPFIRVTDGAQSSVAGMLVDEAGFSYLRLRRS